MGCRAENVGEQDIVDSLLAILQRIDEAAEISHQLASCLTGRVNVSECDALRQQLDDCTAALSDMIAHRQYKVDLLHQRACNAHIAKASARQQELDLFKAFNKQIDETEDQLESHLGVASEVIKNIVLLVMRQQHALRSICRRESQMHTLGRIA